MRRIYAFTISFTLAAALGGGLLMAQMKQPVKTPSTVLHVITVKWKSDATNAQKQAALDGVKKMASEIPGIANIWLKTVKVQPSDYSAVIAIELRPGVIDAYATPVAQGVEGSTFRSARKHHPRRDQLMALGAILFLAVHAVLPAQEGAQQFASLGDFRLESGRTIRDCRIGYRTFGTLDAEKSNAVLFPTWFTGTTADLAGQIGPGKLVDSRRTRDRGGRARQRRVHLGSNSRTQPRLKFPVLDRDMVDPSGVW
jgi:hypothetical protein